MKAIAYTFLLVIVVFSLHLAVDYLIDSHLEDADAGAVAADEDNRDRDDETSESREDSIEQGPVNHLDLDDEGDGVDNPEGGFQDWADDMKLPLKALPHREAQDHEETEDVEEEAGVGHGDDHPSYVVVKQDGTDDEEDYVDITHGKA